MQLLQLAYWVNNVLRRALFMTRCILQVTFIVLFISLLSTPSTNAATINAASCSQSNVQSAVNSASSGDTVNVPSCPSGANWSSRVDINSKSIVVHGAGSSNTIINGNGFRLTGSNASRITGFRFNLAPASNALSVESNGVGPSGWRMDHCIIYGAQTHEYMNSSFYVFGWGPKDYPMKGLIDNCEITSARGVVFGQSEGIAPGGKERFAEPLNLGTDQAIYVENCTFTHPYSGGFAQMMDGRLGSKWVVRFNKISNNYIEAHSPQGTGRGFRSWEIYKNTLHIDTGYENWFPFSLRGGTGVVWGNTLSGAWTRPNVGFDLRRLTEDLGVGKCTGSNPWDGNRGGSSAPGWPCRDQIGTSTDQRLWTSGNPYPPQSLAPAYIWSNYIGSNRVTVLLYGSGSPGNYIVSNRDYYEQQASSFNGTSGVGVGTLANRPPTCTTGVGYWATDQGSWNTSGSGEQGVLYKCTSTNTWTSYYTPYTYPHPIINQSLPIMGSPSPPGAPNAPSGVKLVE